MPAFTLRINQIFSQGSWVANGNLMEVTVPTSPGTDLVLVDFGAAVWNIDIGPDLTWDQLPGGFTLVGNVTWSIVVTIQFGSGCNVRFTDPDSNQVTALSSGTYGFSNKPLTLLDLHAGNFTARATVGAAAFAKITILPVSSGGYLISGNYSIVAYTFTIDPASGATVQSNQLITITSPDADLDGVVITLGGQTIVPDTQSDSQITFTVPPNLSGICTLVATGDGTQFAGSITLGSYTVLLIDASGIYVLTAGKTNDTIYDRANPGETEDVAIPDPFFKTGFIGS